MSPSALEILDGHFYIFEQGLGCHNVLLNIAIIAIICNIFHNIEYQKAVSGFYFEKKMHVELPWRRRTHAAV